MSDVEHATGTTRPGTFPESWGPPPGRTHGPERASWVRAMVRRHMAGAEIRGRQLAARTATTRLAQLVAKRYAPGERPESR